MAPNCLGSLAQYDTPPPTQGNTPIPNTQPGGTDKGPQMQKRKRAGSKSDKEQTAAPQKNAQNQKKARTIQKEQGPLREDPSPANQEEREQTPLPLQHPATGTMTPQTYSLPNITNRNSPPLPPSPTEEARLRKKTQAAPPPPPGKPRPHNVRPTHRKHIKQTPSVTSPITQMTQSPPAQRNHERKNRLKKQRQRPTSRKQPQTKTQLWRLTTRRTKSS